MPLLAKHISFSATHRYFSSDFSESHNQKLFGSCINPHGHNYTVEVALYGTIKPKTGMIINFYDLDPVLTRVISDNLDHKDLNRDVLHFKNRIPTPENIALYIWTNLVSEIENLSLCLYSVKVTETPNFYVKYNGADNNMLTLTRRYTFAAAHKLWSHELSEEENRQHFGPCANLHGHNYVMEITISGQPSDKTGMIMNIRELDELVNSVIVSSVDHRYLNEDVPYLSNMISTVENMAQVFYKRVISELPACISLHRVRLYETEDSWVEVVAYEDPCCDRAS